MCGNINQNPPNNRIVQGEWMKDCKQGYGVLDGESGGRYEGTWHDNHRDGYGMEVYKDGGNSNNMDFCLKKWFQL